jgi:hypothetical protein
MIWLLTVIVGAYAAQVPCGSPSGCLCSSPILHTINCQGGITVLPLFEPWIKPGVVRIQLIETNLVDLPPFLEELWPRLGEVFFRGNEDLSCEAIGRLRRKGLYIDSDCLNGTIGPALPTVPLKPEMQEQAVALTIVGGISIVCTIGTILGVCVRTVTAQNRYIAPPRRNDNAPRYNRPDWIV